MEEVQVIDGYEIPEGKKAFRLEGLQNPSHDVTSIFMNADIGVFMLNGVWYAIVDNDVETI